MKQTTKNLLIGGSAGLLLGLAAGCVKNAFSSNGQNDQAAAPEEPQNPANQAAAPAPTDKK